MVDKPNPAEKLEERFPGKYLSLTSYKRDGTGVSTPVWFVVDDGRLLVMTDPHSFKVKRIRRNPNERVLLPWVDQTLQRLRGKPDAPPTATLAITPQPSTAPSPDGMRSSS